jgi:hypothetical protein
LLEADFNSLCHVICILVSIYHIKKLARNIKIRILIEIFCNL